MFRKKNNKNLKSAFTLVELLVVIAIIGILATLAIVAIQNTRAKARDTKRIADVKQIQIALELYFNDNGSYPVSTSVTSSIRSASRVYMEMYPQAPTPPDGDCTESNNQYVYTETGEDNGSYALSFCLGRPALEFSSGDITATPLGLEYFCGDTISYEGESYPSVQIGTQCWLAKDLNVGNMVAGSVEQSNNSIIEKYCYDGLETNCDKYGGLYQWDEMMQYSLDPGIRGICPSGWHIPTDGEWTQLTNYVINNTEATSDTVARWLKSCRQVTNPQASSCLSNEVAVTSEHPRHNFSSQYGINYYGFTSLPGGRRSLDGSYTAVGTYTYLWSSSVCSSISCYRIMRSSYSTVNRNYGNLGKTYGFSVRCLKD
ncbi:MAG: FISUMP domain-containing protein [Patescibacteria group bacterium]|jgi:uncharacterized protein (TIGR02145 family)/prepilin-type N-terminal cleavage/methylation domain-containing protein